MSSSRSTSLDGSSLSPISPGDRAGLFLTLSSGDHLNAFYTNNDGVPLYEINTPRKVGPVATVRKLIPDFDEGKVGQRDPHKRYAFLGKVNFGAFRTASIQIDGEESLVTSFFKTGGFSTKYVARARIFTASDGKEYKWKMGKKYPILLRNDGSKSLVAQYHLPHRVPFTKQRAGFLEITPEGYEIIDSIMMTFAYVERLRSLRQD